MVLSNLDIKFSENQQDGQISAISFVDTNFTLSNSQFTNTNAILGGSIKIIQQQTDLILSDLINNVTFLKNKGNQGGAIFISGGSNLITINNSKFINCEAFLGGAIRNQLNAEGAGIVI